MAQPTWVPQAWNQLNDFILSKGIEERLEYTLRTGSGPADITTEQVVDGMRNFLAYISASTANEIRTQLAGFFLINTGRADSRVYRDTYDSIKRRTKFVVDIYTPRQLNRLFGRYSSTKWRRLIFFDETFSLNTYLHMNPEAASALQRSEGHIPTPDAIELLTMIYKHRARNSDQMHHLINNVVPFLGSYELDNYVNTIFPEHEYMGESYMFHVFARNLTNLLEDD